MLYIVTLAFIIVWMAAVIYKERLSWHSIAAAYVIPVFIVDMFEVLFNLILGFYRFPTHLIGDPVYDNQLGIIFADTLILPFSFIIFIHYAKDKPIKSFLGFALRFIVLELIYLKTGYFQQINWKTLYSAAFYTAGFAIGAYLTPHLVYYRPPLPYPLLLLCLVYTANMWTGAFFGLPVLNLYQFSPGIFSSAMVDCRFVDLYSGLALAVLSAVFAPITASSLRPLLFAGIACIGITFALYAHWQGWLIYRDWNHFLTALRYLVPFLVIALFDRWESSYRSSRFHSF